MGQASFVWASSWVSRKCWSNPALVSNTCRFQVENLIESTILPFCSQHIGKWSAPCAFFPCVRSVRFPLEWAHDRSRTERTQFVFCNKTWKWFTVSLPLLRPFVSTFFSSYDLWNLVVGETWSALCLQNYLSMFVNKYPTLSRPLLSLRSSSTRCIGESWAIIFLNEI